MTPELALILSLAVPATGAFGIAVTGAYPNLREAVTLFTASTLFAVVLWLLQFHLDGGAATLTIVNLLPDLPIRFEVEPLGLVFALVASGLWIVTSVYSIGYMRGNDEANQTRFYVCFAIALASAIGIAFAGNMLTLFLFYEILTISTYPLVAHKETPEAKAGARIYLGILLTTSILFLLTAVIWTWFAAGTLNFRLGGILAGQIEGPAVAILFALYMFGIGKAALMPFHGWLPAAMVAPTPVSALLHAVAVVKAGVFTVLKVAVYIFGVDFLAISGAADWLLWVAAFTLIATSIIAVTKDNLKARLAYSTISQLAYVTLGVGLATSMGIVGGTMQIVAHALGKITLFMCAGAIYVATHKTEISQMRGLGRLMPFTFG
ncbi:MAG TPA: cation:proton antiporter, partial [Alphaproteobacteria bacterium]|nr:cation:proton antiporter [Alphaproteobacteria bacterium]